MDNLVAFSTFGQQSHEEVDRDRDRAEKFEMHGSDRVVAFKR